MTTFVLVRHGETEWNRQGRIQGHSDSALTPEGVAQAEAMGRRLGVESIDHFLVSDLGRARHTAAIISQHVQTAPVPHAAFRERAFGVAEGLTYAEIDARFPEMFSRVRETDPDFAAEGGESRRQFSARVVDALHRLADTYHSGRVLVVTHGGVLAAVYRWAHQLPIASAHQIEIPNVAYNRMVMRDGAATIEAWADVAHLAVTTHNDRV